jgi:hypothetical protein
MKGIRKRLKKLEANDKMQRPFIDSSPAAIKQAALAKLSDVDRALFHDKSEGSEETQASKEMLIRWEGALATASREAGVIYLNPEERGWL